MEEKTKLVCLSLADLLPGIVLKTYIESDEDAAAGARFALVLMAWVQKRKASLTFDLFVEVYFKKDAPLLEALAAIDKGLFAFGAYHFSFLKGRPVKESFQPYLETMTREFAFGEEFTAEALLYNLDLFDKPATDLDWKQMVVLLSRSLEYLSILDLFEAAEANVALVRLLRDESLPYKTRFDMLKARTDQILKGRVLHPRGPIVSDICARTALFFDTVVKHPRSDPRFVFAAIFFSDDIPSDLNNLIPGCLSDDMQEFLTAYGFAGDFYEYTDYYDIPELPSILPDEKFPYEIQAFILTLKNALPPLMTEAHAIVEV